MGNRRLSRKRLYQVEKAGQAVDLGAGAGIKDAIVSATQHRNGQEIITEIAIDLGTSKADITCSGSGANGDTAAIGVDDTVSSITQMTVAKYGIITEVRAVLVETIAGGIADLDLEFGTDAAGKPAASGAGTQAAGQTSILTGLTTVGHDVSTEYDANNLANKYLYLCQGDDGTGATYTGGKVLIYLHGFVAPDDV